MVVVFNHNIPVRFVNQQKLNGSSRSHAVHIHCERPHRVGSQQQNKQLRSQYSAVSRLLDGLSEEAIALQLAVEELSANAMG